MLDLEEERRVAIERSKARAVISGRNGRAFRILRGQWNASPEVLVATMLERYPELDDEEQDLLLKETIRVQETERRVIPLRRPEKKAEPVADDEQVTEGGSHRKGGNTEAASTTCKPVRGTSGTPDAESTRFQRPESPAIPDQQEPTTPATQEEAEMLETVAARARGGRRPTFDRYALEVTIRELFANEPQIAVAEAYDRLTPPIGRSYFKTIVRSVVDLSSRGRRRLINRNLPVATAPPEANVVDVPDEKTDADAGRAEAAAEPRGSLGMFEDIYGGRTVDPAEFSASTSAPEQTQVISGTGEIDHAKSVRFRSGIGDYIATPVPDGTWEISLNIRGIPNDRALEFHQDALQLLFGGAK